LISRPAALASWRQRCKSFNSAASSASSFLRGWRSMPGTTAQQATSIGSSRLRRWSCYPARGRWGTCSRQMVVTWGAPSVGV